MRVEIHKSQETTPLILHPKILNFDNTGSSANRREIGSSTLAYALAWGATPKDQPRTTQDHEETFVTPNKKDPGNLVNNNSFTTNTMDVDARMIPIMAKEFQQL